MRSGAVNGGVCSGKDEVVFGLFANEFHIGQTVHHRQGGQHSQHPPGRAKIMHDPRAAGDAAQYFFGWQHARKACLRVFAQRNSDTNIGIRPFGPQPQRHRHFDHQKRRMGKAQIVTGNIAPDGGIKKPLQHRRRAIRDQRLIQPLQDRAKGFVAAKQRCTHMEILRTLPRKQKGRSHAGGCWGNAVLHCSVTTIRPRPRAPAKSRIRGAISCGSAGCAKSG